MASTTGVVQSATSCVANPSALATSSKRSAAELMLVCERARKKEKDKRKKRRTRERGEDKRWMIKKTRTKKRRKAKERQEKTEIQHKDK